MYQSYLFGDIYLYFRVFFIMSFWEKILCSRIPVFLSHFVIFLANLPPLGDWNTFWKTLIIHSQSICSTKESKMENLEKCFGKEIEKSETLGYVMM